MRTKKFLLFCKAFSQRLLPTSARLVPLELSKPLGLVQAGIREQTSQVTLHGPSGVLPGRCHRISPA